MSTSADIAIRHFPRKWHNLLTAPLIEGDVSLFLQALDGPLAAGSLPPPPPDIIQALIYYTLISPTPPLPTYCPTPISLLYKISSLHPASTLMFYQTIPAHERQKLDTPYWFRWAEGVDVEGQEYRAIARYMKRAEKEGIWGLLWASDPSLHDKEGGDRRKNPRTKRKRGRGHLDEDEDSDEEEEGRENVRQRQVSENGWILLEWLVDLWEKDQSANEDGWSPAFLAQLPKLQDMQIDNPSAPLEVVGSVIHHPSADREEQRRRQDVGGRILALLVASALGPLPPFHPPSLPSSLFPLFRLPPNLLSTFLTILSSHTFPAITAHFITHAIEDTAGTRSTKSSERRRQRNPSSSDFLGEDGVFPRPTLTYMLGTILLLHGQSSDERQGEEEEGRGERLSILKLGLVASMLRAKAVDEASLLTFPESDTEDNGDGGSGSGWAKSGDESWRQRLRDCMAGQEGMGEAVLMLLDQARGS